MPLTSIIDSKTLADTVRYADREIASTVRNDEVLYETRPFVRLVLSDGSTVLARITDVDVKRNVGNVQGCIALVLSATEVAR
jgi:hypothetical protein